MQLGYIGLGKMGLAQVERLLLKGWRVVAWNRSEEPRRSARKAGAEVRETLDGVCERLMTPRIIWLMVSHAVIDDVLKGLLPHLSNGDTIIDGGNSFYKHSMRRARALARHGIHFLDVGVSGGPSGARGGACLMVGGDRKIFTRYERLFSDLSAAPSLITTPHKEHTNKLEIVGMSSKRRPHGSYAYVGRSGAGHFVKMVHNGIEYGMMQSIGEGFEIMKESKFRLPLKKVADLYNKGSVIESRLMEWLAKAFGAHGEDLKNISGVVAHSGEGLWTVKIAKELGVPVKVIKDALDFRLKSKGNPSYTGQVISALRNQFGGHHVRKVSME
ncbi:MAG: 6-phosphogluconate dehydrogenase (decarboxylating) [Candidatus Taylorbacteria bacterium RIFCSPHIGHO2_02_49_25]|uniref:6-phosphogluconate dehydrogenase (Decarboxylating) n=1 Tax=Candidatus Taylorbacteria bacterium RIFCSPHIGHO2_02_49_25 TaxID=1802305 RepID=A0A1G2MDA6_9BACT|nr:MAG: 6-phosphogluconate dehydrogenase (decarboxylating) [Candidatus Taylorbacteria bacterium RIFCSPHIGHO2_01_FULL_49_60]OHA21858.1 MAG: 6-phosphogluconate dehydrogenase (decarboxylating) [Candidatus Taylorbacteria bacterium RIFCSPHIGHO2_02_49_25]OHA35662.1 MAG: 6-phosphogluconate dehydrogenase (decarboxylating) [Candidatus Taylorbacteria bacterium RIFCSPLOWO2_02_50_13]OHA46026.1 MAG: 6-phosphogluconate dehydrogenase (decarboxylating) [Candidatus Taylorbacteria bacterium RIFCSPLOWO2_12_FULL_49